MSTRLATFPPSHIKTIRTTPSVNGKLKKLCAYLAANDHDENALGPTRGSSVSLPKTMLRPDSARIMKQVAVIQCTERSKALKRTMLTPERPDSMRTMP